MPESPNYVENALSIAEFLEAIKKPVNDLLKDSSYTIMADIERFSYWGDDKSLYIKMVEKAGKQTVYLTVYVPGALVRQCGYTPEENQKVLVIGTPYLGKNKNEFQIKATHIEDLGIGRMQRQIADWRKEYQHLFDRPKKPLPFIARSIAVISNSNIQGFGDFNKHLRYGQGAVLETKMQGEGAAVGIARAIAAINKEGDFDLIVIVRGGGSFADLFEFNRPEILTAIAESSIPVATAVGHETDWPLCDSAADYRFSTPTHAGRELTERVEQLRKKTEHALCTINAKVVANIDMAIVGVKRRRDSIKLKVLAHIEAALQKTQHRKVQLEQALQSAEQQAILRSKHRKVMIVAAVIIIALLLVVLFLMFEYKLIWGEPL